MTFLHRRPREVYRVYSEEEYLDGAGSELSSIGDESSLGESPPAAWPLAEPPLGGPSFGELPLPVETVGRGVRGERRLRRMAGVAMLAGVVGAVGGVVILNLARAHGTGTRGSLVASTRSSRAVRSPAVDDARPQVTSSRPVLAHPVETAGSPVSQNRRGLGALVHDRFTRSTHRPVRRRTDVAVTADDARPAAGEVSRRSASPTASAAASPVLAPAPAQVSTSAAGVTSPPARPAPEKRPEFGFEH
jgi:hypothetical protein